MVMAFWGSILLSLFVMTVQSIFDLDMEQKMALRHIRSLREAAKVIQSSMLYFKAKKRLHMLKK